jgi:hypothetical protein
MAAGMMVVKLADGSFKDRGLDAVTIIVAVVGLLIIIGAFWFSRRQGSFGRQSEEEANKEKKPA